MQAGRHLAEVLRVHADYPFKAPSVRFETACFHPNVDQHGNICLDILKEKWSAAYSVRTVLLSIQSLLGEPNNDSPLNAYAAKVSSWLPRPNASLSLIRHHVAEKPGIVFNLRVGMPLATRVAVSCIHHWALAWDSEAGCQAQADTSKMRGGRSLRSRLSRCRDVIGRMR